MKILDIINTEIEDIKVVRFERFSDHRGYFSETYRKADLTENSELLFLKNVQFDQINEAFSYQNTFRGLHFQYNPFMGKLIRCISGRLFDFALDIRKNSPTFGQIIAVDMPSNIEMKYSDWVWLPPGFAHGTFVTENSLIEYMCSGTYNPECEISISVFANDIDWTFCDIALKDMILKNSNLKIRDRDLNAISVNDWLNHKDSDLFNLKQL